MSATVRNPVGDPPVFDKVNVCWALVVRSVAEPKSKLVGPIARTAGVSVVLVVVVLVVVVELDDV